MVPRLGLHARSVATFRRLSERGLVDGSAPFRHGLREPLEIRHRMKPGHAGQLDSELRSERQADVGTGGLRRQADSFELRHKIAHSLNVIVAFGVKVSVHASEIAVTAEFARPLLDEVDRIVACPRERTGRIFSEVANERLRIVVGVCVEMGTRSAGRAAADKAGLDHGDLHPEPHKMIGSGQSRDTGTNDRDIGRRVAGERRITRGLAPGRVPVRIGANREMHRRLRRRFTSDAIPPARITLPIVSPLSDRPIPEMDRQFNWIRRLNMNERSTPAALEQPECCRS